jgi:hypothetical protein
MYGIEPREDGRSRPFALRLLYFNSEDETFDELLTRLLRERQEAVRAGAGLWEDSDAAERAREARTEMKRGVGDP